jgi:hypothetical protein
MAEPTIVLWRDHICTIYTYIFIKYLLIYKVVAQVVWVFLYLGSLIVVHFARRDQTHDT